jgi:hypothetical protein
MRQLIATTSGGHSAIRVVARRTSQRTKNPKRMTKGTNRTTRSSRMPQKPSTSSSGEMRTSVPGENRNCSSKRSCLSSRRYHDTLLVGGPHLFLKRRSVDKLLGAQQVPLVLDLVVAEVRLTRVLIDGGSGLNLIFTITLRKMGLDLMDMLVPSQSPFYGIVPGNAVHPLGTVVFPVTFGTRENYRTEFIKFEVANFESSYHAILGRPALAKFMAVPHYVYLLLKMPGRSGVLTLRGDLKKSYDCNQVAIQYASTAYMPDASGEVLVAAQQLSQSRLEIPTRKASKSSIQSTGDVALKMIQLHEGDSSKIAAIGAGLDEK